MEDENDNKFRLAALCRKIGNMLSEEDVAVVDGTVPLGKTKVQGELRESSLTLFGCKTLNFQKI